MRAVVLWLSLQLRQDRGAKLCPDYLGISVLTKNVEKQQLAYKKIKLLKPPALQLRTFLHGANTLVF